MHYAKLLVALAPLSAFAVQLQLPSSDIPSACRDTCQAIMDVANSCANSHLDDSLENQCICVSAIDGTTIIQSGIDTDAIRLSDIDQIINVCNFSGDSGGSQPSAASTMAVQSVPSVVTTTTAKEPNHTKSASAETNTLAPIPTNGAVPGAMPVGGLSCSVVLAAAGVLAAGAGMG
ncbi:uncharacterized protein TRIVIDRAFT_198574 [Trichoderma virens Gv29-8]|uniref:Extracellular membrane protein CFEM domain-containing protein n=1 Tax=Hypocrea virens (strain Gv29-8 / FGSC 10586) TaxID=413071 RepID=G9MJG3_HYPVG|nr:uncharacterized protein TRIVIDRAFT_198574 [Trichoderma virens Gv29-8]EHK25626.1 hypothetical protein TRIVIDRAFT_198574 [Trichoderma virens Gv29-8]UKZ48556.1 hypothetical protein TrVGV298_002781 [Trichoderma virens]